MNHRQSPSRGNCHSTAGHRFRRRDRRLWSVWFSVGLAIAVVFATTAIAASELQRYESAQRQMGVSFKIILYTNDAQTANRAFQAAFSRIKKLNGILSDYDPQSELSRLSASSPATRPVAVSDDLWRVLDRSQRLAQQTEGAFDITVGPYTRLWRRARRQQKMPSAKRLAAARDATGYRHLKLDARRHSARLLRSGMRLDLGGIAKGYAADEALKVLRKLGVSHAMVDGSGDITLGDPPPGERGWRIGVAPLRLKAKPSYYLSLSNCAIATSGDAFQYVVIDGRRYSHIINPATGLGLTLRSSVTIIAADGLTADSLASAVSLLGPAAGTKFVEGQCGVESIVVYQPDDDEKIKTIQSTGLLRYVDD